MSLNESMLLFAPVATRTFGEQVASACGVSLAAAEEREFDGGEHKMRPLVEVRDRSAYVIQSLFGDALGSANDRLCRLLFFVGALRDAGARRVIACIPYLAYARKDQRTKARDPVSSRYVAELLEAMGTHAVIILGAHNRAAVDNAFRIESQHLEATRKFVHHFASTGPDAPRVVVSPDIGGIKRARHFQELLSLEVGQSIELGFMDKKRSEGVVSGKTLVGEVRDRQVILIDDLIGSGGTVLRVVAACRDAGALRVDVAVTHAAFNNEAHALFTPKGPDSVLVTDSVTLNPAFDVYRSHSLSVMSVSGLYAEAIRRYETGGSLAALAGL